MTIDSSVLHAKLKEFFGGFGLLILDTHSMQRNVEAAYKTTKSGETALPIP